MKTKCERVLTWLEVNDEPVDLMLSGTGPFQTQRRTYCEWVMYEDAELLNAQSRHRCTLQA